MAAVEEEKELGNIYDLMKQQQQQQQQQMLTLLSKRREQANKLCDGAEGKGLKRTRTR